jgi:hypothetical protein
MTCETQPQPWRPFVARGRFVLLLSAGIALAWPGVGARAELYRWTDADGVTVYSERPPPGAEAIRMKPDPGPSAEESQRAEERIRSLMEQDFDRREDEKRAAEESAKATAEAETRRANCEAAQANLATLENLGARRLRLPNGESRTLSDDERERYLAETRERIQKNCP